MKRSLTKISGACYELIETKKRIIPSVDFANQSAAARRLNPVQRKFIQRLVDRLFKFAAMKNATVFDAAIDHNAATLTGKAKRDFYRQVFALEPSVRRRGHFANLIGAQTAK